MAQQAYFEAYCILDVHTEIVVGELREAGRTEAERMKADQILRAGLDTLVQRGVKRDQPDGERSMPRIVHLFHAMTGIRLTEREGCCSWCR
jgi:hypothetical protein